VLKRGQNIVKIRRGGRPAPTTVNSSVRTREYLTTAEIERLMAAARKSSRYGHRDATMILIGYRHGLRASELCDLQWSQVELATGRLHVRRAKNGSPSVHPMQGDEIRALRRLQREQGRSSHVFMTERDGPMTPKAFHALFGRIGSRAKMQFPIHPYMLRHGCGYALANAGHDTRALQAWLGSTPCVTPSLRRIDLRTSGDNRRSLRAAGLADWATARPAPAVEPQALISRKSPRRFKLNFKPVSRPRGKHPAKFWRQA
jgi:integrase